MIFTYHYHYYYQIYFNNNYMVSFVKRENKQRKKKRKQRIEKRKTRFFVSQSIFCGCHFFLLVAFFFVCVVLDCYLNYVCVSFAVLNDETDINLVIGLLIKILWNNYSCFSCVVVFSSRLWCLFFTFVFIKYKMLFWCVCGNKRGSYILHW